MAEVRLLVLVETSKADAYAPAIEEEVQAVLDAYGPASWSFTVTSKEGGGPSGPGPR